jgi:acetyltransferase
VGGVMLDLANAAAVRAAAAAIEQRMRTERPDAPLEGFVVQPMIRRPRAHELIAGIATDPVFGPVILFGQGGTATEVVADRALALPPLDTVLARDLIERTRVARLLAGYRDRAPVDLNALATTLVQLSALAADLPEIAELDINPLLADERGVIALDARVRVAHRAVVPFAIRPYPEELEQRVDWEGRAILLRPIRPEDGEAHRRFFATLDPEDVRYRTFMQLRTLAPSQLARLTQIDYDREMAFLLLDGEELLGVGRLAADPGFEQAEFALVVASDRQRRGYGELLLRHVLDYARKRGAKRVIGHILRENHRMIGLSKRMGFAPQAGRAGSGDVTMVLQMADL